MVDDAVAWLEAGEDFAGRSAAPADFDDLLLGPQHQAPPAPPAGDLLIRDRLGQWTYDFCVAVDDLRHGVNLVIRGEDLLHTAQRQIALGTMLGRSSPPRYLHHPLILDEDGRKLSKRDAATAISRRREAGEGPEGLLGEAAFGIGLAPTADPLTLDLTLDYAAGKLR